MSMSSDPGQIRVATYNLENLYKGKNSEGLAKTPESVAALGKTLSALDADIVAVEEVQSEQVLDQFVSDHLPADSYPYRAVFPSASGNQNVGVLSRFPITSSQPYNAPDSGAAQGGKSGRMAFERNVGCVDIDVKGVPLKLYVAHLKADPFYQGNHKPEEFEAAKQRRMDQVEELRELVGRDMKAYPSRHYIVAGDMNATPESPEMKELRTPGDGATLVDPLADKPAEISHPATGHRYDYMLLDPETARTVTTAGVFHADGAETASDHLPLVYSIDLKG